MSLSALGSVATGALAGGCVMGAFGSYLAGEHIVVFEDAEYNKIKVTMSSFFRYENSQSYIEFKPSYLLFAALGLGLTSYYLFPN